MVCDQDQLKAVYKNGYYFYQAGKYDEAIDQFCFLVFKAPLEEKYWLGLGAAQHMNKQFREAIDSYGMAAVLNKENPFPHLHAADCFFALALKESYMLALNKAEEIATKHDAHSALLTRIKFLKELL